MIKVPSLRTGGGRPHMRRQQRLHSVYPRRCAQGMSDRRSGLLQPGHRAGPCTASELGARPLSCDLLESAG